MQLLYRKLRVFLIVVAIIAVSVASLAINPINLDLRLVKINRDSDGPLGLSLGLDLQGGSHLVYQSKIPNPSDDQMQGALHTIERRVNAFGVSEPLIQRFGDDRIVIQMPGIEDIEQAKALIGTTARLEYKNRECLDLAADPSCLSNFTDKEIGLTGEDMTTAYAGTHSTTGEPVVNIQFNSRGSTILGDLTSEVSTDSTARIAIFLDDTLVMTAGADEPILGGSGYIRGGFTFNQAKTLAIQLEAGRLPIPLMLIQERLLLN